MRRRLSAWLLLSASIHAGLVAALLLVVGLSPRPLPLLFVDLVQGFLGASDQGQGGPRAAGDGRPAGPSRSEARRGRGPEAGSPREAPASERSATREARTTREPVVLPERTPPPPEPEIPPPPRGLGLLDTSRMVATPAPSESQPPAAGTASSVPVVEIVPPLASGSGPGERTSPGAGQIAGQTGAASSAQRGSSGSGAGSGRVSGGDGRGLGVGAREGSVLALAIPGDGTGIGSEYQGYARLLRRRVQEALEYPAAAQRRQLAGSVNLKITVDAAGAITEVALAGSSSHRLLDEAAVQAARDVQRVPFPPDVAPRPLRVPVTVRFDLR